MGLVSLNFTSLDSFSKLKITKPEIIYDIKQPDTIVALSYTENGKRYLFSNNMGHKVFTTNNILGRPMTKKEFKSICQTMLENSENYGNIESTVLGIIESLDFGLGHANSTFEVAISLCEPTKISALVMNIGNSRFLYNQDTNAILHIDHSKRINGTMLTSPFKEQIIDTMKSSKTMIKKIANAFTN